jgi:hypothetical protein
MSDHDSTSPSHFIVLALSTVAAHLGQVAATEIVVAKAKKIFRRSVTKIGKMQSMKWILDRMGRLSAVRSEQSPGHEPNTPANVDQTASVPNSEARASASDRTEAPLDSQRNEIGLEASLKDVPGVTERMLVAFGQHGIRSIEDLAACATDDLDGWSESKDGQTIRHEGILDRLSVSRQDCEAIIMNARFKAGWFT